MYNFLICHNLEAEKVDPLQIGLFFSICKQLSE